MKTLQQRKDCIVHILQRYESEFSEQIERLNIISTDENYDIYFSDLCVTISKAQNDILPELHFCQNPNKPTEIQKTNIN
jgi:hypothetical protein